MSYLAFSSGLVAPDLYWARSTATWPLLRLRYEGLHCSEVSAPEQVDSTVLADTISKGLFDPFSQRSKLERTCAETSLLMEGRSART